MPVSGHWRDGAAQAAHAGVQRRPQPADFRLCLAELPVESCEQGLHEEEPRLIALENEGSRVAVVALAIRVGLPDHLHGRRLIPRDLPPGVSAC